MEQKMNSSLVAAIEAKALEDDKFMTDLFTAQTMQDTQAVLSRNGFDVSLEEVEAFFEKGRQSLSDALKDGELSEAELESVAGGGKWRGRLRYAAALVGAAAVGAGFGFFCGVCPAAAVATPYVAGGYAVLATAWVMDGYAKK